MDFDAIVRSCVALCVLGGCPAGEEEGGDTDVETEAAATMEEHACHPGTPMACACTDGAMGTQVCNADGQSYGPCECSDASSTGAGSSSSTTGSVSDPGTDPTADTGSGDTTGDPTTGSSGESTSEAGCEPGETMACDCGDGPGVAICSDGGFGACECCMGTHPLVEGDLRYCEPGECYCGDFTIEPPLDVCWAEAVADACCPVEVECY